MTHTISSFKGGFNGGTRANRFLVTIPFPTTTTTTGGTTTTTTPPSDFTFHCVSAILPASELGVIKVPYRGRMAYYAGDRDYKPWTVTILDDSGNKNYWIQFQKWANLLNNHATNTTANAAYPIGGADPLLKDLTFTQLHSPATSGTGVAAGFDNLKKITLHHAWPSEIGEITLDMAEGGSLISYSVTFVYNYLNINNHS